MLVIVDVMADATSVGDQRELLVTVYALCLTLVRSCETHH